MEDREQGFLPKMGLPRKRVYRLGRNEIEGKKKIFWEYLYLYCSYYEFIQLRKLRRNGNSTGLLERKS